MKNLILILLICFSFSENIELTITSDSKVEIYSALFWAPCKEAKSLLRSRGIEFESKMITFSRGTYKEMVKRTGGKQSVPQILVDGQYFGDLNSLKTYFNNSVKTKE